MQKLATILTPDTILEMDDSMVQAIAGESEESIEERASSTKKREILEEALQAIRRFDKRQPGRSDGK